MTKKQVLNEVLFKMSHLKMYHTLKMGRHTIEFYNDYQDREYLSVSFSQYIDCSNGWLEYHEEYFELTKEEYDSLCQAMKDNYSRVTFK